MTIVGWIIAAIFFAGLAVAGCIAVVNDEDSLGPISVGAWVGTSNELAGFVGPSDHEYDDWGGGSDGNSGGEYEGGRGGSDYDGDGDGPRCRNFCFYGLPAPEPGEEGTR